MSGESILVVGASGGLGGDVVRALVNAGCTVTFTGRRPESLARMKARIPGAAGRLLDATEPHAVASLMEELEGEGGLGGYVHLAGGYEGGRGIEDLSPGDWDAMFDANWVSLRNGAGAAFAAMRRRGGGTIVTIGSLAGVSGGAKAAPYAVSKAAVIAFTRCLAEEGKSCGVRANCIVPGILDTEANRAAMPGADRGGWVSTEDVARTVVFLCSADSVAVNGATILMKGGL